jgi:hypothetical protein
MKQHELDQILITANNCAGEEKEKDDDVIRLVKTVALLNKHVKETLE